MWKEPVEESFGHICGVDQMVDTCICALTISTLSLQDCAWDVDKTVFRRKMRGGGNFVEKCGKVPWLSTGYCTVASMKLHHPRRFIHRKLAFIHRFWVYCAQFGS